MPISNNTGGRIMKYDLIVVGGGPGGLSAAKTAAEEGLKVLLIERKKNPAEVNRLCGQFTNIKMISVSGKYKYGYSEPLNFEIGTKGTKIHYPAVGYSLDYNGPLRPYYNYLHFSPSGNKVYREKDHLFAFFIEKESLLAGLLDSAQKAGAEIMTGTMATGAENTPDGVKVSVRDGSGEKTLEAKRLIAADGHGSVITESVGLNKKRQALRSSPAKIIGYVLEGVETEYRMNHWVCFTIPSLSPVGNAWMFQLTGDRNIIGISTPGDRDPGEATERLMKMPFFKPWFKNARVIKKLAAGGAGLAYGALYEPALGNVLAISDTGTYESTNPGAVVCGYLGVKATIKEMNGEKGYAEYTAWWQQAFEGNTPDYRRAASRFFSINSMCTDEDVDYLYDMVGDQVGVPAILVAKNMDRVKKERPDLYAKFEKVGVSVDVKKMEEKYLEE